MTIDISKNTSLSPDQWGYRYRAHVVRVVDGDTLDVNIDLGFHVEFRARVRLAGYNAPELHGLTAVDGKAARDALVDLLGRVEDVVYLQTAAVVVQSFERYIADGYVSLNGRMESIAGFMKFKEFDVPLKSSLHKVAATPGRVVELEWIHPIDAEVDRIATEIR